MGLQLFETDEKTESEATIWFAPDFLGNLDLKPEDRAEIGFEPMSARELQRAEVMPIVERGQRKKKIGVEDMIAQIGKREQVKRERILEQQITGLRRWSRVNADGTTTAIDKWSDLYKYLLLQKKHASAVSRLLSEIYDRIVGDSQPDEEALGE